MYKVSSSQFQTAEEPHVKIITLTITMILFWYKAVYRDVAYTSVLHNVK